MLLSFVTADELTLDFWGMALLPKPVCSFAWEILNYC